jgi:hypothetical protein
MISMDVLLSGCVVAWSVIRPIPVAPLPSSSRSKQAHGIAGGRTRGGVDYELCGIEVAVNRQG